MPGTVLGTGEIGVKKGDLRPSSGVLSFIERQTLNSTGD